FGIEEAIGDAKEALVAEGFLFGHIAIWSFGEISDLHRSASLIFRPQSSGRQEVLHDPDEFSRVLDFGAMAGAVNLGYPRPLQRLTIAVDHAARHHRVAIAPYQQGRDPHPFEALGKTVAVHERLPPDPRGFGARILEALEHLGGHLAAIDFAELRGVYRVGDRRAQVRTDRHPDDVEDFALLRPDSQR